MDTLLNVKMTPETPIKDINLWLESLEPFIDSSNTRIFNKVVGYKNAKNKSNHIAALDESLDRVDWEQCVTLEDLFRKLRGSGKGTMAWMCNNIGDVVKQDALSADTKVLGRSYWHSYLLLYKDGCLYIWDADFQANGDGETLVRIGNLHRLALVRELANLMRRKDYCIRRFYMIGGGNSSNMCNELTQKALIEWIRLGCEWEPTFFDSVRK